MRALTALLVGAAVCGGASACSCLAPDVPNCGSEYALVATAGGSEEVTCPSTGDRFSFGRSQLLITFKVEEVLKQPEGASVAAGDVIQISTATNGAACGVNAQKGTSYLLYPRKLDSVACTALETDDMLSIGLCGGNVSNPTIEEIDTFKEQCVPEPEPEPEPETCEEKCTSRCESRCERLCKL